ncbi:MAG TPA: TRAP transporter TatT component family protein [Verrucomicrobiota bacterium]|nr:TRAP transporter TatT component family protein [Verrucomicrobiota bacterium]HQB16070.1 TRAP transporter TatT component family protein [Verrucomicrobiota bacterium]
MPSSDLPARAGNIRRAAALLRWLGITMLCLSVGCSVRQMAVNKLGDALAGGGTTFASEDDPELVQAAVPFSLKLMESLLAESPKHQGLLLATAKGFTQFAYAFVQQEADEIEDTDYARATALRERAKRLYLRARNYGLRGLEVNHPGLTARLASQPREAVQSLRPKDVPLLYWTGAAWAAAIALSKDAPALIGEIPQMEALMDRALELDENFDDGALHSFFITYEMSRSGAPGIPAERARKHFERAVALSNNTQAGPFVTFAEAVCVQEQDLPQFEACLQRALAINPDAQPETRLVNLILQRRARWLLSKRDELFLLPESPHSN